ncbi:uncharacterized protein LOC118189073 [Stegodyphus dumicola]|uniref:uncharacterized protein LOC118189073 n=1 Tax=Stegodyphus dumicola TaxID=202533 RepID=UPI0015AE6EC1|nr:uncharacterized protein LOC118189073 [Stegodyphus dumicola]XP_035215508.1 uncharacterized protein LOC118189073 [Stegodyphus dumicola]
MASQLPDYSIRPMEKEEIPEVLDIWRETKLSEGTHSLDTWFSYDPEGFYVAVTNDGEILGVCAGVLQNEDLAFIGLYVVKSSYQRKGIGKRIWDTVMERVGLRNAGVNPVPEQLANYRDRAGFGVQTSWCSVVCVARDVLTSELCTNIPDVEIQVLKPGDDIIDEVTLYDADVYGFSRRNLVKLLCEEGDSITVAAIKVGERKVCGYGCIKENIKGNALVGPLYADETDIAELILYYLIKAFPLAESRGVTMTTIDCNQSAMDMTEKAGFFKEPGIARLYTKEEVNVKFEKVFGQHNLNFSVF